MKDKEVIFSSDRYAEDICGNKFNDDYDNFTFIGLDIILGVILTFIILTILIILI